MKDGRKGTRRIRSLNDGRQSEKQKRVIEQEKEISCFENESDFEIVLNTVNGISMQQIAEIMFCVTYDYVKEAFKVEHAKS